MKSRNYGLDLMRVVLSLCVITMHSLGYFELGNYYVAIGLPLLLISADGLFYIASGYFNLEKEFNSSSDIKKYYKNKILYVLFPFLAFVFVWTVWDYVHLYNEFDFLEILKIYYESIVDKSADGHMWFMYPLFGMLLATPFLSKMLHAMDEKELKILWYVALGFNFFQYFLCYDFGFDFRFSYWFMDGWPTYYVGGYYYRHVIAKESKIKWLALGLIGYAITFLGAQGLLPFLDGFVGGTDNQMMLVIFCMASFMFWDKTFKIKEGKLAKVITILSKNTYMIYLYHMRGIEYAVRKLSITGCDLKSGLLVVFGAFIFSLIAAYVTNLCMKPVQKFVDKKWAIK